MAGGKRTPKASKTASAKAAAAATSPAEKPPRLVRRNDGEARNGEAPSAPAPPTATAPQRADRKPAADADADGSAAPPPKSSPPLSLAAVVVFVLLIVAVAAGIGGTQSADAATTDGHCCRMQRHVVLSRPARSICAQAENKAADLPVFLRRLLVGSPAQRADVAADVRRGLGAGATSWVEVGGQTVPELIRALEPVGTSACCLVLWVPDALALRRDTADVLKSLIATGGVGGRRLLRTRTSLLVGAAADDDLTETLPARLLHLLTRVTL